MIETTLRHVEPTKTTDLKSTTLTKNAERREKFRKLGQAISSQSRNIDSYHGGKGTNPWRCIKGATGYFGMQIDNRPGVARRPNPDDEPTA